MSKHHNADHYFLDRAGQKRLRDKLAEIPNLVDELAITTTRQDHPQRSDLERPRRPKRADSALPYRMNTAKVTHELHNSLATWVRLVCEHRAVDYEGRNSIIGLARWLEVNMISLAMTPGGEEAYADISGWITACHREIDLPPEDHIVIDRARVESANKSVVTLSTITAIASRLGPIGKGLNRERLRLLAKRGDVEPDLVDEDTGTKFYLLGDVLHAHHNRQTRRTRYTA